MFTARNTIIVLLALLACAGSGVAQESRPVVRVAAEVTARGERLTLGELAEVMAKDETARERLSAISLGYAPNVGAVREISRDRIALALAAAGFTSEAVQLEAPALVRIRRAAQVIEQTLIREAVERVALADLTGSGATARLVRLDLPALIEAPSGRVEVRASTGTVRDLFAPFTVFIEVWIDGRLTSRFSATAQVEAHAPVVVAARDVAAGTRARRDDFTILVRRLERPAASYIRDLNRLRGLTLRQAVARGEALVTEALTAEIIIRPGDAVRIIAQSEAADEKSGCLQIVVEGEARGAGRIGERIPVRNKISGALLQAKVVDEGLVRVEF
ncbi:MAG TPA: flagellar basal body P-ring formation chaperone FlgA [Blastocatellia bacterium]|nr:flagellar basal body P-ring formation chaperone FlgA [Blastocatellia bacterium]